MKLLIALCLVVFIQLAYSQYGTVDEEWAKWKKEYNKSYKSPEEEVARKKIFARTLARIIEHNRLFDEGKVTYQMGLNQFADLNPSEVPTGFNPFPKHHTGFIPHEAHATGFRIGK